MKKKCLLIPVIALSLAALCACKTTVSLGLSANWKKDTTNREIDPTVQTIETLTYAVAFEPAVKKTSYTVGYENGTFTTTLRSENIQLASGASEYCYRFTTELKTDVYFEVGGQKSETFSDTSVSEVWFRSVSESLQPVKSVKTVKSHTPVGTAPTSFTQNYYEYYELTRETVYNDDFTRATINQHYTRQASAENTPKSFDVENKEIKVKSASFFDNEEILFAIRALDMTAAVTLKSIDPSELATASLSLTAPTQVSRTVDFTMKSGSEEKTVNESVEANEVKLSRTGTMSGRAQTLVYAAKNDSYSNTYRNALIYMEVPVSFDLGTLKYTLKTAVFSEK